MVPVLLIGSGPVGPRQARILPPLARPLYFLASPRHPSNGRYPDNYQPLVVGEKKHELAVDQWQEAIAQYPGHPALARLADEEASWHQLRREMKGLPQTGFTSQDRSIILFLLQNRLAMARFEQDELARELQQANARLMADLDSQEPVEELVPVAEETNPAERLAIWAGAASLMQLPPAIWAMPLDLFNAWQPASIAEAPLTDSQLDSLGQILHGLWMNPSELAWQVRDLARQSQNMPHGGQAPLTVHCLPGAAMRELLNLTQTPEDFLCLALLPDICPHIAPEQAHGF